MKSIADFFSRIQGKQAQKILLYSLIKEAVSNRAGIDTPLESIAISGKILTLKGLDQAAKSVIFIKKAAIIDEINKKMNHPAISDIRT